MAEQDIDPQKTSETVGRVGLIALGLALAAAVAAIAWTSLPSADEAAEAEMADASGPLSIDELAQRVEDTPDDPGAWQELAFARFERGEFDQAVSGYERAAALDDDNAVLWSSLGEARVMGSERDPMPPAAVEAFEKALALDPQDPRARYFLAVRRDLSGDHVGAIDDWLALLADTPPGAPWEDDLTRTIEQVGKINEIATKARLAEVQSVRADQFASGTVPSGMAGVPPLTGGAAIPGPSDEQIAAAKQMAPGEQRQMAEGMVARLAERLEGDPSNIDGWVMLMRSRMTLDQPDLARAALARAKAANPQAAERLDAEAELLGVR
ncbi:tetratricopeptide repeat protein [Qipengyuania sp. DGS5-3]|uniref:tetratricopeptide repeat protein n=1 Tax=Qipengyuania sp. DGS5-3 TaxID=3349632 RepID=UPI0036D30CFC